MCVSIVLYFIASSCKSCNSYVSVAIVKNVREKGCKFNFIDFYT